MKSFGGQKGGSSEPPWTPPAYGPGLHSSLWWYNKFLFWFEGLTNRNKHWVSVYAQRNWAERVVSLLIALRARTEFWDTLEMWIKPQLVALFFLILVSPGIINFALSPWWDWKHKSNAAMSEYLSALVEATSLTTLCVSIRMTDGHYLEGSWYKTKNINIPCCCVSRGLWLTVEHSLQEMRDQWMLSHSFAIHLIICHRDGWPQSVYGVILVFYFKLLKIETPVSVLLVLKVDQYPI